MRDDRNGNADAFREIDALQVDVQQIAANGVMLPVDDHHRRILAAFNVQIEDGVVPGLAVQDLRNLPRADRHRHRVLVRAINHARDQALATRTPRFILAAGSTWLRRHRNIRFHCISSTGFSSPKRLFAAETPKLLSISARKNA